MGRAIMIDDGRIHREKGASGKSAWYVSHGKWGARGDWATGEKMTFSNGVVDVKERAEVLKRLRAEERALQKQVAHGCLEAWKALSSDHTLSTRYLDAKGVQNYWCRVKEGVLYVPVRDVRGRMWNFQKIYPNGKKFFVQNGRKKGCFHNLGEIHKKVFVCEGYATAATVKEATDTTVIVAFDAGNLMPVVAALKKKYPNLSITIAADNDCWKPHIGNVGMNAALRCREVYSVGIRIPLFDPKHKAEMPKDWNDMLRLEGMDAVKEGLK